jgi:cytidine deaminase
MPRRAPAPKVEDLRRVVGVGELVRAAKRVRRRAHAPFSSFTVGAALRGGGRITTGCNVESATYGLTICAERSAVVKAVSEGIRRFDAIAVVTDAKKATPPCGACRQFLWELCGDIWIHMETLSGRSQTLRLSTLLPLPFDRRSL